MGRAKGDTDAYRKRKKKEYVARKQLGDTDLQACDFIGINPRSIARWRQDDEDFVNAINLAIENFHRPVINALYEYAMGNAEKLEETHAPNFPALKWILANKMRKEWKHNPEFEEKSENTQTELLMEIIKHQIDNK